MDTNSEKIELRLPFKAEYVSVARLTASGIASRIGFDIEAIEDIKVAIAEVCNKLVVSKNGKSDYYTIVFNISHDSLTIVFECNDDALRCIFGKEENGLGISIIKALMDDVNLCTDNGSFLSMTRCLEGDN